MVAEWKPWSLTPKRLGPGAILRFGAGSMIAAFYIGTGDISIATTMGAKFGFNMWWTYFILAVAAWAIIDMTVRYFLATGRTPMSVFKETHPAVSVYMFITIIVCAMFGAYSQWNATAMVITGFWPEVPLEAGGAAAALLALLYIFIGSYKRLELFFVFIMIVLLGCFGVAALLADTDWSAALAGLLPRVPGPGWMPLFLSNAGSMINAWMVLFYPYTMMEKRWRPKDLQDKVNLLHRVRYDYCWGAAAAGVVALPIMATATAVAKPFGMVPGSYMDLAVLLEPFAGPLCMQLFLIGLFAAAWTSGLAWWLCGAYALLDLFNLPVDFRSRPMRLCIALFFIPSTGMLFLHINPVLQIILFAGLLSVVFPVIGLALVWRISQPDMGYFRWTVRSWRGIRIIVLDVYAVALSLVIGWVSLPEALNQLTDFVKTF